MQRAPKEKRCAKCGEVRGRDEFNTRVVDGRTYLQPYCRSCHASAERARYAESPSYRAAIAQRDRRSLTTDSRKKRAANRVYAALQAGTLTKGPCEVGAGCRGAIQAHHDDYDRPLDVRWLCRRHHVIADKARRAREAQERAA